MFTSFQRFTGSVRTNFVTNTVKGKRTNNNDRHSIAAGYSSFGSTAATFLSLRSIPRHYRKSSLSSSSSSTFIFRIRYRYQTIMEYTQSTNERYASSTEIFVGEYRYTRALLDYRWHVHYKAERQLVQDTIIRKFLEGGVRMDRPWLVYTAGPMGAGKSHTIRYLHKQSAFPLDRFVTVDPDRIKSALPDMPLYIHNNKTQAGTLTHKESGFIAEIIELEAMKQNKCILVDGSLRHREWYARWFGRVRAEFPQYRIAILLITASPERVYERAARRALITAREIPKEILDEAIVQVPISFNALAPLADYTATLVNDHDTEPPIIQSPESLETFRQQWQDVYNILPPSPEISRLMLRSETETYAAMVESIDKIITNHSSSSSSSSSTSSSTVTASGTSSTTVSFGSIISPHSNGTSGNSNLVPENGSPETAISSTGNRSISPVK